ncbi:Hypothetical protein UVM_LOCUS235 [uncultured virus]|nr:Hypothetical protein UVM_LOCUS235 [uncultured virus]
MERAEQQGRSSERERLLEGVSRNGYGAVDGAGSTREKMLAATARLEATTERLQQSQQVASETEVIGVQVLSDLDRQRTQLTDGDHALDVVDENVRTARVILAEMTRRALTNKILLAMIIAALIAANVAVVYFKWIRKKSTTEQ